VSTYGDVYSFGILILEMLTGRRPTDEMFKDGQNLRNFVAVSIPNNLLQILDRRIISEYETTAVEGNCCNLNPEAEKCGVSLLRIGLACSVESPKERMNLVDVIRELNQITRVSSLLVRKRAMLNSPRTIAGQKNSYYMKIIIFRFKKIIMISFYK